MKFAKHLAKAMNVSDPEWAPYWINYKQLKKMIKKSLLPSTQSERSLPSPRVEVTAAAAATFNGGTGQSEAVCSSSSTVTAVSSTSASDDGDGCTVGGDSAIMSSSPTVRRTEGSDRPRQPENEELLCRQAHHDSGRRVVASLPSASTPPIATAVETEPLPPLSRRAQSSTSRTRSCKRARTSGTSHENSSPQPPQQQEQQQQREHTTNPPSFPTPERLIPSLPNVRHTGGSLLSHQFPPRSSSNSTSKSHPTSGTTVVSGTNRGASPLTGVAAPSVSEGESIDGIGRPGWGCRKGSMKTDGGTNDCKGERRVASKGQRAAEWKRISPFFGVLMRQVDKCSVFFLQSEDDLKVRLQRLQLALSQLKDPQLSRMGSVKDSHVKLMQACVNFYREALLLEDFAMVNFTAVIKLLKKRDKITGTAYQRRFMAEIMHDQPFAMYPGVAKRVAQVERIFQEIEDMCFLKTEAGMKSIMRPELTVVEAIMKLAKESKAAQEKEVSSMIYADTTIKDANEAAAQTHPAPTQNFGEASSDTPLSARTTTTPSVCGMTAVFAGPCRGTGGAPISRTGGSPTSLTCCGCSKGSGDCSHRLGGDRAEPTEGGGSAPHGLGTAVAAPAVGRERGSSLWASPLSAAGGGRARVGVGAWAAAAAAAERRWAWKLQGGGGGSFSSDASGDGGEAIILSTDSSNKSSAKSGREVGGGDQGVERIKWTKGVLLPPSPSPSRRGALL